MKKWTKIIKKRTKHIYFWRHACKDREHKKPLRGKQTLVRGILWDNAPTLREIPSPKCLVIFNIRNNPLVFNKSDMGFILRNSSDVNALETARTKYAQKTVRGVTWEPQKLTLSCWENCISMFSQRRPSLFNRISLFLQAQTRNIKFIKTSIPRTCY